jgi:hypothetical protein
MQAKSCVTALAAVSAIALSILAPLASAQEDHGPFVGLSGAWVGTGRITMKSGANERIRCRAKHSTSPSGADLHQELLCASDSYKFDVNSNVVSDRNGSIEGTWTETSRNVTGHVSGRVANGAIRTTVQAPSFSANLLLEIRGNRQTVSIAPEGVDVKQVSITLQRS